jgi:protein SSD1
MCPIRKANVRLRSAAKLSYSDAQGVIDGKSLGEVPVIPEHNAGDIAHDIKILDDLAKQLRERRFQNGAVGGQSLELKFSLDDDGMPADCISYQRTEAHSLVEEVNYVLRLTAECLLMAPAL